MTDEAILNAWHSMRARPTSLTNAAVCRSESDWLVGLNSTRALTILQSRGGFNVTPPDACRPHAGHSDAEGTGNPGV
ncbi:MAG: hypothetical protein ACLT8E_01555 [Akkermansia sp.]